MRVVHAREPRLAAAEFRGLLVDSGLGKIRPVDDLPRLQAMIDGANLIVAARLDQPDRALVGVARCVTDFSWCCYLSDLAVSRRAQGLGVGMGLLEETRRQLGPTVSLLLALVPEAVGFYEKAGMARQPDAFWYRRER